MARPRTKRHTIIENALCLDLYRCFDREDLKLQFWGFGPIPVSRWGDGHGYINAKFDFSDHQNAWLCLEFDANGKKIEQLITLKPKARRPFGGQQWFFQCPLTGQNVRKLYLPCFGNRFLSRQAHNLKFATERMSKTDRDIDRVCKFYKKLTGSNPASGTLTPPPFRPKGRHMEKYSELYIAYAELQERLFADMNSKIETDRRRRSNLRD